MPTCPTNPAIELDADGFCSAHGNDCDDFALSLSDAQQNVPEEEEGEVELIEPVEPEPGKILAFFADSRTSPLLLADTITMLARSHRMQHGIVELNTPAGVIIATALSKEGIDYTVYDLSGEPEEGPDAQHAFAALAQADPSMSDEDAMRIAADWLRSNAAGVVNVDPGEVGAMKAQLVVLPATVGTGVHHLDSMAEPAMLDLSPTTLPGLVFEQAQQGLRTLLLIDAPERGIVTQADGLHHRRILHVGLDHSSEMPS